MLPRLFRFLVLLPLGSALGSPSIPDPFCITELTRAFQESATDGGDYKINRKTGLTPMETARIVGGHSLRGNNPVLVDLRNSIAEIGRGSEPIGPTTLKEVLTVWAERNGLPWKFVVGKELRSLGSQYLQQKTFNSEDLRIMGLDYRTIDNIFPESGPGGFIPARVWNRWVSEHLWPVADYHDVLSHAPQLADPFYAEAIHRKAVFYERCRQISRSRKHPLTNVAYHLMDLMDADLRVHSYEALTYLEGNGADATLVTQGAAGFAIANQILSHDWNYESLGESFFTFSPFSKMRILDLPNMEQYLSFAPQAYQALQTTFERTGVAGPQRDEIRSRLASIETGVRRKVMGLNPEAKVNKALHEFALKMQSDPVLTLAFSKATRMAILTETVSFLEGFLAWQERR